jgi:ATP-dependent DNA ligase
MEAETVEELPTGDWQYEPKWDGFRGVLENLGGGLRLWSRNGRRCCATSRSSRRSARSCPPESALDGEIIVARKGRLEFDQLQLRLHPAESRIKRPVGGDPGGVRRVRPARLEGRAVHEQPFERRRRELERKAKAFRLSPATRDPKQAAKWLAGSSRPASTE